MPLRLVFVPISIGLIVGIGLLFLLMHEHRATPPPQSLIQDVHNECISHLNRWDEATRLLKAADNIKELHYLYAREDSDSGVGLRNLDDPYAPSDFTDWSFVLYELAATYEDSLLEKLDEAKLQQSSFAKLMAELESGTHPDMIREQINNWVSEHPEPDWLEDILSFEDTQREKFLNELRSD